MVHTLPERNHQKNQYCISQMKRFAICMKTDMSEGTYHKYQFFYTLGRIQELLKSSPKIWWNPFEIMIKVGNTIGIENYTETLRRAIGCEYDPAILMKGC
jgi:hypothetical protein